MELSTSLLVTRILAGIVFTLWSIEMIFVANQKQTQAIWSFENLIQDLTRGLPGPRVLKALLSSSRALYILPTIQLIGAIGLIWDLKPVVVVSLFIGHILTSIRFRGTFNGGSDMMANVVLMGLFIASLSESNVVQSAGLVYISIHLFLSYLKAGLVKLRSQDWRSGQALFIFLKRSPILRARKVGSFLAKHGGHARFLCWMVIGFELSFILIPFGHHLILFWALTAVLFHLLNFYFWGLNRFFWIWLTAWPSLIYVSNLI